MNLDNLTTKSREVVTAAVTAATSTGHSSVEPAHLLGALLVTQGSTAPGLLRAVGADPSAVLSRTETILARLPRVSGSTVAQPSFSRAVANILIILAIQAAPANRIAPAQYSQIVWAVLLGALFFGEIPDAIAFAGIALVTFAGLFTFVREQKRGVRFPPVWTMVWGRGRNGKAEESA